MPNNDLAALSEAATQELIDLDTLPEQIQSLRNHAAERRAKGWLKSADNLEASAYLIETLADECARHRAGRWDHTTGMQVLARHGRHSAPAGEVEPVAWKITDAGGGYWFTDKPENPDLFDCEITQDPLYTHPAPPADLVELVEALREAREALHFHYVEWDGEPEDAVPLQLARAKCDAALAKHGGA